MSFISKTVNIREALSIFVCFFVCVCVRFCFILFMCLRRLCPQLYLFCIQVQNAQMLLDALPCFRHIAMLLRDLLAACPHTFKWCQVSLCAFCSGVFMFCHSLFLFRKEKQSKNKTLQTKTMRIYCHQIYVYIFCGVSHDSLYLVALLCTVFAWQLEIPIFFTVCSFVRSSSDFVIQNSFIRFYIYRQIREQKK